MQATKRCSATQQPNSPACEQPALSNGKCRSHGGASTGPRTAEGKARVSAAQRLRWQRVAAALAAYGPETV